MNRHVITILLLSTIICKSVAQNDIEIEQKVNNLTIKVQNQQIEIDKLYSELNKEYRTYRIVKKDLNQVIITKQELLIDSLNMLIEKSNQNLATVNSQLDIKIRQTEQKAEDQFAELDTSVSKNRILGILGTLAAFIIGGLIYMLLGNRIKSSKTDVETQIRNTKASLEEESVKLDNKLIEVLDKQLKLYQETSKSQPVTSNDKADHSLALKVADEIIRIQKNLSRMDDKTKGLKQLNSSVKRIQDNFASNGYELVEMIGKEYNEGMKVTANFIPSEELETGKQIISRIIKPQVNFKDEMIQAAQIEVSVGE